MKVTHFKFIDSCCQFPWSFVGMNLRCTGCLGRSRYCTDSITDLLEDIISVCLCSCQLWMAHIWLPQYKLQSSLFWCIVMVLGWKHPIPEGGWCQRGHAARRLLRLGMNAQVKNEGSDTKIDPKSQTQNLLLWASTLKSFCYFLPPNAACGGVKKSANLMQLFRASKKITNQLFAEKLQAKKV